MKKILLSILAIATILSMSAIGFADDEVKLLKMYSSNYEGTTYNSSYRSAIVKVKNIAYQKQVKLHLELKDGTWIDSVNGIFQRYAEPGWEIWKVDSSLSSYDINDIYADEFVVKYTVAGETYWDNNNGSNYSVNTPGTDIILGNDINVLLDYAYAYKSTYDNNVYFYGYINLKNIAYSKVVNILYTTDNWATSSTVSATYNYGPTPGQVETWGFNQGSLDSSITEIEFAIEYIVGGVTYWDNNFGMNYKITVN